MECAESIPERVSAVIMLPWKKLVRLSIHTAIFTIDVIEDRRRNQHVIKRSIKNGPLGCITCFDSNAPQLTLPGSLCLRTNRIEIPPRHFGLQVPSRIGNADPRQSDAHQNLLTLGRVVSEYSLEVLAHCLH